MSMPLLVYRGLRIRPPHRLPGHGGGHFPLWVSLLIIIAIFLIVAMIRRRRR